MQRRYWLVDDLASEPVRFALAADRKVHQRIRDLRRSRNAPVGPVDVLNIHVVLELPWLQNIFGVVLGKGFPNQGVGASAIDHDAIPLAGRRKCPGLPLAIIVWFEHGPGLHMEHGR